MGLEHVGAGRQRAVNLGPAHPAAASVNDPDFPKARQARFVQVVRERGDRLLGPEGVEVEGVLDRDPEVRSPKV